MCCPGIHQRDTDRIHILARAAIFFAVFGLDYDGGWRLRAASSASASPTANRSLVRVRNFRQQLRSGSPAHHREIGACVFANTVHHVAIEASGFAFENGFPRRCIASKIASSRSAGRAKAAQKGNHLPQLIV